MIRQLFAILKKNILRLARSKISAAIILLGPILLIGIIGFAVSNDKLYGITVGVYMEKNSPEIDGFLKNVERSDFSVRRFATEEECISSVTKGISHVCAVLPAKFSNTEKIKFHVDYSKMNLVNALLRILFSKVTEQSDTISYQIVEELLKQISDSGKDIKNNIVTIRNLSANAYVMQQTLGNFTEGIRGISFGIGSSNDSKQIDSYFSGLSTKVTQTQASLEVIDGVIGQVQTAITDQQKDLTLAKKQIDLLDQQFNCTTQSVLDLNAYFAANKSLEEVANQLNSGQYNQMCSIIVAFKRKVAASEQELAATQRQATQLDASIDVAKSDLVKFKNDSASLYTGVNAKIDSMEKSKTSMLGELEKSSKLLESSQKTIKEFESSVLAFSEKLENTSKLKSTSIVFPVITEVTPIVTTVPNDKRALLSYIFPSVLILMVMFVSVLVSSTLVLQEKTSPAFFRNLITPVRQYSFMIGLYFTAFVITALQLLVIMGIAAILFAIPIFSHFLPLAVSLSLAIILFASIGIIIGNLFNSEETAVLTSIFTCLIMFLFSNILVPIEKITPLLAPLAQFNPFVLCEILVRRSLIYGMGFEFSFELAVITVYIALAVAFVLLSDVFAISEKERK